MPVIENHKELVPFEHYLGLYRELDPIKAAERCKVSFDTETGTFRMRMMYSDYTLTWPEFTITSEDPEAFALKNLPAQMLLIRYLLEGSYTTGSGSFMTYRELPWGEVYLKPFTGRCLTRAAYAFGTRLESFKKAAETMPVIPLKNGDAGYQLEFMPGYDLRIMVWEGDDEFPPNTQILFSDNFKIVFSAEDRTVMGDILISDIKRRIR